MKTMRKTGDERRADIAGAALRILGRGGRKALTIATLADEVGFTNGALYRHYPSVEDVVAEAAQITIDAVEATFPPASLAPLDRLLTLARRRVDVLAGNPGHGWMLRSEQAPEMLPPRTVTQLRGLVRKSRRYLLRAIRDGQSEGAIRTDIAAEPLLTIVMGTIHASVGKPGARRSNEALDALAVLLSGAGAD